MTNLQGRKAVFLDRDGVINRAKLVEGKSYPPQHLCEFEILPGVEKACKQFKDLGYLLVVVTNQPDVSTGIQSKTVVEEMHHLVRTLLPVDAIYVCFHVDADRCQCRKPEPGMLLQAAKEHQIDLTKSILVGDRWKDVAAGQKVGCRCFFIDYGYSEPKPIAPFETVASLEAAALRLSV